MSVKVRFAPSPTGTLRVGNGRTALVNGMFAHYSRGAGAGQLIWPAPRPSSNRASRMPWLGLVWDERDNQSKRLSGETA